MGTCQHLAVERWLRLVLSCDFLWLVEEGFSVVWIDSPLSWEIGGFSVSLDLFTPSVSLDYRATFPFPWKIGGVSSSLDWSYPTLETLGVCVIGLILPFISLGCWMNSPPPPISLVLNWFCSPLEDWGFLCHWISSALLLKTRVFSVLLGWFSIACAILEI